MNLTVDLIDVIEDPAGAVVDAMAPFFAADVVKHDIYSDVRSTLKANMDEVAALYLNNRDRERGALLSPREFKGNPRELVQAYLKGTPLIQHFYRKARAPIPEHLRFEGMWIVAPQGRGKTTLLLDLLYDDLEAEDPPCVILMDSKGDLTNPIRKIKDFEDRLVILEPNEQFPLALNPLDLGASRTATVALLEYLFSALMEHKFTALQATLFRSVFMVMTAIPGATFSTLRQFLRDGFKGNKRFEDAIRTLDPEDQDFFFKGEYDSPLYRERKYEVLARIHDLTTRVPILRDMFRSPRTRVNMGELMDQGKIVIIDNSKQLLDDDGAEFFGRFFIALVRAAANQRSRRAQKDKRPVFFYIDECQTVIKKDEKIASIIQECRSQNIGMILAHQATTQITSQITLAALSDCAIRMTNADLEAGYLAPRFRTTPEFLSSLKRGEFAVFVRDITKSAVKHAASPNLFMGYPQFMPDELRAMEARMRERYGVPREIIQQTLAEERQATPPPPREPERRAPQSQYRQGQARPSEAKPQRPQRDDEPPTGPAKY